MNKSRNQAVDIVKGVAIILVVLGHVGQGLNHRHLLGGAAYFFFEQFIYSFHMPAFFFVAGLFLDPSLRKRGPRGFAAEKARAILYPYLLWPLLALPLVPWMAKFESGPRPTLSAYFINLFMGNSGWFLFSLFFILMLAVLTHRLPLWIRLILAVPLSYFWPNTGNHGIDGIFWEYIFVVVGQIVGSRINDIQNLNKWIAALASLGLFTGIALATFFYRAHGFPQSLFIPLGLAGTAGLFCFAAALPWPRVATSIAWFGEASIAIYLLSPYFQGTTREILFRVFHTTADPVHIVLQTLTATLFPALMYHYRKSLHIEWFFKMPQPKSRPAAPPGSEREPSVS
jgi:fucose 4-O-acetylase-like acetyltransferase